MNYALLTTVAALLFGLQSAVTPQPFARFIPGTLAQDLAITPKGGWTYIVGSTTDAAYPVTPDAFDRTCGTDGACNVFQGRFGPERRADVVLTVIDAEGTIRYSTFLGGDGLDDNPRIALASDGTVWLAGNKTSQGFENGPAGCAGSLWIARLEFTLRRIEQFLCISGPALSDIALDSDGTLWVLGSTGAPVVTRNAFQPIHGGQIDMYVAHVTPSDSAPVLATHLGGDRLDIGNQIAITPTGDIAIVGSTISRNFPLVRPLRSTPPATVVHGDAVIAVLDRSGSFLEFSTLWGGIFDDSASGVAVDAAGNLYVSGSTASPDMPATEGAYDTSCEGGQGCRDAFLTKIGPTGSLIASTLIGGSALDIGRGIALHPNGDVMLLGSTQSPDFPLVGGAPFRRWRPGPNFEHSYLATFDEHLTRVKTAVFVGDEQFLPNVPRFLDRNGMAYVAGQVTAFTGAPGFGTYLSVIPLSPVPR